MKKPLLRAIDTRAGACYFPIGIRNLLQKNDARNITTNHAYDVLNRVVSRTYQNDPTPAVTYFYDNARKLPSGAPTFSRGSSTGRLVAVTYGGGAAGTYMGYDTFGRATVSYQQTFVQSLMQSYQMGYGYDLSGAMTSETCPSGKVVNMAYDTAGRVTTVSKQGGGNYASSIAYAPQGAIASMTLGNMLLEQTTFNSRLQPTLIQLGVSTSNAQSVLGLAYMYSTTGHTDNNGNVLSQAINAGTTLIGSQSYTYDGVDRLQTAMEGSAWNQTYDYDQFGNRAVRVTSQYIPNPQLTPTSTATGDLSASISAANNRIIMQGFGYDLAGNLTGDPTTGPNAIAYDAENRQTSYTKSTATGYGYDGDGHRVTKIVGGSTTVFVYNVAGELIAEYGGAATNGGTSYLTTDHLGSTRVVTNSTAGAVARHDYLPFGEEIPAGTGSNRMAELGYVTTDDTTHRFTSKERDTESGLDYFGARYYTAAAGRFSGCDPYNAIVDTRKREEFNRYLGEPRNWNRYCFVWNNPLKYVDPSGEDVYVVTYTYGNSEGDEQFKRAADTRANDIRNSEGFDPNKDTVVLQGVYKKEDFAGVLQDAHGLEKQYGKVAEVTIFSHTGEQHGPVFHDENGKPTQFTTQEVRNLKVNWSDHANAYFCGCRSANFAQTFADIQGVTSYGFSGGASFSSNPLVKDYRYVFSNNAPVYLRQAARDPFGIGASLTVPMVRRDPPPKDTPRK